ncbi:MAG TPA: sigma-54 dependent transcriptional regulator [Bryobacteraceae bacterium]|nr:sigma-54 dependent transcriptional regulator [Bryobacteraceae bacterium]
MRPSASILLVDDDAAFRHVMSGELRRLGHDVATASSGEEAVAQVERKEPQIVLLDLRLPGMDGLAALKAIRARCPSAEVIMLTGHGSIDTAIESIRVGAFDYVTKPCPLDEIEIRVERAIEQRALRQRASLLERGLTPSDPGVALAGESPEFRRMLHLVELVGPSDSTVLIAGETGSGKERVARLLHARSPRKSKPFVVVDCAALQESLLQSELFGHERGAFTGADKAKPGLFEVAHGGTIFLDEIGEISQSTQVNLLRVLDTSVFRHVGGTSEIRVDVRVLAATNRDLRAMVAKRLFREDLFYRMSTITVEIPPLRKRGPDIELLARCFVDRLNERYGSHKVLGESALEALRGHSWPGNVRELLHAVEAAVVVCEGEEILAGHLPSSVHGSPPPPASLVPVVDGGHIPTLDELELMHIRRVLEAHHGHRGNAARVLGISERNLYRKLKEHRLLG